MDPQTVFLIAITTARMIMPGMPNIPGMGDFSAPTRTLTMDLTSDKKANAKSKAECAIPEDLLLGAKLNLTIDLPQKAEEDTLGESDGKLEKSDTDFKIKAYWGCSQTVLEGQPKVIDSKELDKGMRAAMNSKAFQKNWSRSINAMENGSHAYWPGKDNRKIDKKASCPGDYELTTNYCGGTSITFGTAQDFLNPINLTSPGKSVNFAKYIKLEWDKVPHATAYLLTAFAGKDNEMVTWTSSSSPNPPMNLQGEALSKEQIEKYIKNGVLLPADATECCIPEGIFKSIGSAMLSVVAFGTDKSQVKDGITTSVIVRSTAMMMLGTQGMGDDEDSNGLNENSDNDDDEPAVENGDSGDVDPVDKTNDTVDEVDKVKDTINRVKGIFRR